MFGLRRRRKRGDVSRDSGGGLRSLLDSLEARESPTAHRAAADLHAIRAMYSHN